MLVYPKCRQQLHKLTLSYSLSGGSPITEARQNLLWRTERQEQVTGTRVTGNVLQLSSSASVLVSNKRSSTYAQYRILRRLREASIEKEV